jgi:hypothetical protein
VVEVEEYILLVVVMVIMVVQVEVAVVKTVAQEQLEEQEIVHQ